MANKIFDRDTLLDLTVNVVPLFIIAFFIVAFTVYPAFGTELLPTAVQFGLLVVPFVFLAVVTYFSGKAVSGAEKRATVFPPGQATVRGVGPLHESEADREDAESEAVEAEGDDESAPAVEGESDRQ